MDVLPRMTRQLFELFREMSPVQRATFVAVPLFVLAGLAWLVAFNRPDDHQAVLFGKTFTSDELAVAEKALNQAGLLNYRREDRKLLAPVEELDRYNAALVEFDAVPTDLGSQILKQFETLGPFSTDRHRQEMKDALLLQELRRMIKAVPDIEDARVAVASSNRRVGFGQKPRVTANVTVKPRAGRDLSRRLVSSLRQAVASMVPDLMAADVTVFDVATGLAHTGEDADEPFESRLIQRVREFTRQYEQQIQKALTFIPEATVAVHVDLDNLKSSVVRKERIRVTTDDSTIANRPGSIQQVAHEEEDGIRHAAAFRGRDIPTEFTREVTERELLAAMPRAVQVSVSIPRDYYRDVALRRKAQGETNNRRLDLDSIEEEVLTKVERTVGRLIPIGSNHDAISVTTVDRMPVESAEAAFSSVDQITVLAWRHGGSWALGLFTVWALWMLSRVSRAPRASTPQPAAVVESTHVPVQTPQHPARPLSPELNEPPSLLDPLAPPLRTVARSADRPPRPHPVQEPSNVPVVPREEFLERIQSDRSPAVNPTSFSRPPVGVQALACEKQQTYARTPAPESHRRSEPAPHELHQPPTPVEAEPFDFLCDRHPDDIRDLLDAEQPQTIAVIAAQLSPALSAAVLAGFAPDRQADVLQRVARLGPTDSEILTDIAAVLKERLVPPRVRAGGLQHASAVLRESPRSKVRSMLTSLEEHDSDLADELRQTLFTFDDLLKLDDETLRIVLQETDDRQWALALKASPEPVRQKVLGCLAAPVAEAFKREMESLGPVRLSEMTSVRQQIADSIRRLEDSGLIQIPLH